MRGDGELHKSVRRCAARGVWRPVYAVDNGQPPGLAETIVADDAQSVIDKVSTSRRRLLQGLAAAGAAAAVNTIAPGTVLAKQRKASDVLIFRLSTRDAVSCNACKRHHRHHVFSTHAVADANRAHPGCNCLIRRQRVRKKTFKRLFGSKGVAQNGVVDLRQLTPKELRRLRRKA